MRRPTLSTKLIAAALPLVLAVVALLAVTVRSDLNTVDQAEVGAELGGVWDPLITALGAIESEAGEAASGGTPSADTRTTTDQAVNNLRDNVEALGAAEAAGAHITSGRSSLSAARRNLDMASIAPDLQTEIDPLEAYKTATREVVAVGQLLPSEAGDPELGRELLAVVKLAEAKLSANDVITGARLWAADTTQLAPLVTARNAFGEMEAALSEFEAIAPEAWASQYRQSGFPSQLAQFRGDLARAVRAAEPGVAGQSSSFDADAFGELVVRGVEFQSAISQEIVERSSLEADAARRSSLIRIGISLAAVLLAALIALFITRSITRRIKAVSASANQVAAEQLPALVEALRDPRGNAVLPDIHPVDARGNDELAELAGAFNSMQDTLVDVAQEQVEVLRRGVSDIFVTMARRNRSLIDRQLAMLDEYEAEVDDPSVLANYYQLDHLATRMRRNSESLLVLAGAEPKRRRVKATEIDDVVRASIGEVEDYRRVDIEHLESLQVRGTVVADVSHLIAELLDNATAFSPPESPVRVGGRRSGNSYLLRIVDSGIGIHAERLAEINELLSDPPIVGLSVESTLGMSVVSLLANKHGIGVTLAAGNPGLTVDISLPSTLFGPIDVPTGLTTEPSAAVVTVEEPIVAWNDPTSELDQTSDETFAPAAMYDTVAPAAAQPATPPITPMAPIDDDAPHIAAADWARMSESLSAFQSGQRSAHAAEAPREPTTISDPLPVPEPTTEPLQTRAVEPDPGTEPALELNFEPALEPALEPAAEPNLEPALEPAAEITPEPAPEPAAEITPEPEPEIAAAAEITAEPEPEITAEPEPEIAPEPEPVIAPPVGEPLLRPPEATPPAGIPNLPPPPRLSRPSGEFDTPLAPPISAGGPSRGPVAPSTARAAAPLPLTESPSMPDLPTRTPASAPEEPEALVDVAAQPDDQPATSSEASALQAALAAFDTAMVGDPETVGDPEPVGDAYTVGDPYNVTDAELLSSASETLPTRARVDEPVAQPDEQTPTTTSRLDPEALRERLRAFQTEFSTAASDDHPASVAQPAAQVEQHSDLGGDRR